MNQTRIQPRIGIFGGSGLYRMEGLTDVCEQVVDTPFGAPSDAILLGRLGGVDVAFLARHGRSHGLIPSQIPFRANVYAMKALGVQYLLSVSAVGSMREDIAPLDMVLVDQFIDLTRKREGSFFGDGADYVGIGFRLFPACRIDGEIFTPERCIHPLMNLITIAGALALPPYRGTQCAGATLPIGGEFPTVYVNDMIAAR